MATSSLLLISGLPLLNAPNGSLDKLRQRLGKLIQLSERLIINLIANQLRKLYPTCVGNEIFHFFICTLAKAAKHLEIYVVVVGLPPSTRLIGVQMEARAHAQQRFDLEARGCCRNSRRHR